MSLEFECIAIEKGEDTSAILGHAGFIKTVEDLYEAMLCSVPGIKFGIAFAEASGPCLVRSDGNDDGLRRQAESSILKIAAGHTFLGTRRPRCAMPRTPNPKRRRMGAIPYRMKSKADTSEQACIFVSGSRSKSRSSCRDPNRPQFVAKQ